MIAFTLRIPGVLTLVHCLVSSTDSNVSGTGFFSVFGERGEKASTQLRPLDQTNLSYRMKFCSVQNTCQQTKPKTPVILRIHVYMKSRHL